ncbi:TolC family protein [Thiohalophilus sp.]|uniref:TolC family protein n=1 Tax=Thiohalophilus sp. TaxID=3028392 RepID=UPI002ACE9288|nr:TolC family protein [Thiohalophilus sp.]MDZ7662993.1 TolC family protein [Thiohalophilus sp.]MDZ7804145.1 TolC family protein [Thiohalophilus sp.]
MYSSLRYLTVVGLCLLAAISQSVASPDPTPARLSLDAALSRAMEYNYAIQAAQRRVGIRAGEAEHAGRLFPSNPELELERADREAPDGSSTTDLGITLKQEIWMGNKGDLREEAANLRTKAARNELDFLRTSVAARTRRAFMRVLLAREAVRTAERVVELAERLQRYARRRKQAGEATRMEVNVAVIGLGRARAERVRAERDLTRARLTLAEILNIDPSRPLEPQGELQPVALNLPNTNTLVRRALDRRRDLAGSAQAVLAARKELRLANREIIPNLTIMGFYKEEESAEITGLGVSVPIPLFHYYSGEQAAAGERLQLAQVERDALMLQVRRETLQGIADYRAARRRVDLLNDDMLAAAEQNLRLTRVAFSEGKVGAPAITTAQDNLLNVRRTYLDALDELISAATALERATGGLIHMGQGVPKTDSREKS